MSKILCICFIVVRIRHFVVVVVAAECPEDLLRAKDMLKCIVKSGVTILTLVKLKL